MRAHELIACTTSTSGHSVNYSVARNDSTWRAVLLPVSFVARGRSTEKRRDSVVADTKEIVCETRDTVEISSHARGGSGLYWR